MCLLLSLGAQHPLKEIAWDESNPQFYVEIIRDAGYPDNSKIKEELGTPYVYNVGSREGCGCGFYDCNEYREMGYEEDEDQIEKDAYINDFNKLRGFLENISEDPIKLMVMWGNFDPRWTFERREVELSQFEMAHLRETRNFGTPIIYILRKSMNKRTPVVSN